MLLADLWLHQAAIVVLKLCRESLELQGLTTESNRTQLALIAKRCDAVAMWCLYLTTRYQPEHQLLRQLPVPRQPRCRWRPGELGKIDTFESVVFVLDIKCQSICSPQTAVALSIKSEITSNLSRIDEAWALAKDVCATMSLSSHSASHHVQAMAQCMESVDSDDTVDILLRACRVANTKSEFDFGCRCAQAALEVAARAFGRNSSKYAVVLITVGNALLAKDKIAAVRCVG